MPIHVRFSSFLHKTNTTFWYIFKMLLTLNVRGDYGSSRPTRVEPQLHCVDVAWQVRGRCVGSAAHSPLHARLAAHALISSSMQFSTDSICDPSKSRPILSKANTIFTPRWESEPPAYHATNLPKQQNFKTLRNIEIWLNYYKPEIYITNLV